MAVEVSAKASLAFHGMEVTRRQAAECLRDPLPRSAFYFASRYHPPRFEFLGILRALELLGSLIWRSSL